MHPDSKPSPQTLFRLFATAEAVTWAGLICALILRAFDITNIVPMAGGLHGFVFLSYVTVTVFVWVNQKWRAGTGAVAVLLSVIPFATVPFEFYALKKGLLAGGWRLAPGGADPHGFVEKVQAWVLRRPVLAGILLLLLVVVVFVALLFAGPPVPKG